MKTSLSLFGGSHLPHVNSPDEKKRIFDHLKFTTGYNTSKPQKPHEKLEAHNYKKLADAPYYALAVPNDLDFLLFFTYFEQRNYCFLIGKSVTTGFETPKCIVLHMNCDESCYDNTLIDVTRIFVSKGRFVLLMTDIRFLQGKKVTRDTFPRRLEHLGNFMKTLYTEKLSTQPFRLQIVRPFVNLSLLADFSKNVPYHVDRILFQPRDFDKDTLAYHCSP